jgi:hypothetical protein
VSLIANERTKLLAGFLNGIGTAMVGAGVIVPLVAFTYGIRVPRRARRWG